MYERSHFSHQSHSLALNSSHCTDVGIEAQLRVQASSPLNDAGDPLGTFFPFPSRSGLQSPGRWCPHMTLTAAPMLCRSAEEMTPTGSAPLLLHGPSSTAVKAGEPQGAACRALCSLPAGAPRAPLGPSTAPSPTLMKEPGAPNCLLFSQAMPEGGKEIRKLTNE